MKEYEQLEEQIRLLKKEVGEVGTSSGTETSSGRQL
jgi:hypothetical protein